MCVDIVRVDMRRVTAHLREVCTGSQVAVSRGFAQPLPHHSALKFLLLLFPQPERTRRSYRTDVPVSESIFARASSPAREFVCARGREDGARMSERASTWETKRERMCVRACISPTLLTHTCTCMRGCVTKPPTLSLFLSPYLYGGASFYVIGNGL